MALIKCPECNGNVSKLAESCPHCGYVINPDLEIASLKKDAKLRKYTYTPGLIAILINVFLIRVVGSLPNKFDQLIITNVSLLVFFAYSSYYNYVIINIAKFNSRQGRKWLKAKIVYFLTAATFISLLCLIVIKLFF